MCRGGRGSTIRWCSFQRCFQEFATLEPSEGSFARFANTYGPLGVGHLLARSGPMEVGEPARRWWAEWSRIRALVAVLGAVQERDAAKLQEWFEIDKRGARMRVELSHGYQNLGHLADPDDHQSWLWRYALQTSDPTEQRVPACDRVVANSINESLSSRDEGEAAVHARVLFSDRTSSFALYIVPHGLLGGMWLQCARAITVNTQLRACGDCGKWFELSLEGKRRQSRYCSPKCRLAAHRHRKRMETNRENGDTSRAG